MSFCVFIYFNHFFFSNKIIESYELISSLDIKGIQFQAASVIMKYFNQLK